MPEFVNKESLCQDHSKNLSILHPKNLNQMSTKTNIITCVFINDTSTNSS